MSMKKKNEEEIPNFQRRPVNNEKEGNVDNENDEEEDSIQLMKRAIEKMDKLQEELDNVRKDFFKFSSLNSSGCNQDVGEILDRDVEKENSSKYSSISRHDKKEFVQSHDARNLSLNPSGSNVNVGVKVDSDDTHKDLQGAKISPGLNWNINQGVDLEAPSIKWDN